VRAAGLEPHKPGPRRRLPGEVRPEVEQRGPAVPRELADELLASEERARLAEAHAAALERRLAAAERRAEIGRAFDRLHLDQRTILVLHHLDGRPLTDIADVLRIPVGTVKSRLHHARIALDRALAREGGR
jgi:RNA polymerase sigma factor (sigma-70 family)